jgi:hypothetical protein
MADYASSKFEKTPFLKKYRDSVLFTLKQSAAYTINLAES